LQIEETKLSGVLVLKQQRFDETRGFFRKSWNRRTMSGAELDIDRVLARTQVLSEKEAAAIPFAAFESPFASETVR
jgi:dTDP-4-dehydrorhamnose 3,5-epimerase-like enzyme